LLVGILSSLQFHVVRSDELVSRKEAETEAVKATLRSDLKKAMQHLGYNAIVLPKDQSLGDWYAEDFAANTMPESRAAQLAGTRELVDRYLPQLRQKLTWEERQWMILVVGVGRERILDTSVCEGAPLARTIPRGSCVVGYELHNALGLKTGQETVRDSQMSGRTGQQGRHRGLDSLAGRARAVPAFGNARGRSAEVAILRAIGYRASQVLVLFLFRSLAGGVVGAALGCAIGLTIAVTLRGELDVLLVGASGLLSWHLIIAAAVIGSLLGVVAGWIPALLAAQRNPAEILKEA
jgi:hypothetical protein